MTMKEFMALQATGQITVYLLLLSIDQKT